MSEVLAGPGGVGTVFARASARPRGEVQVVWPFGRRASAGCSLRTQFLTIGDTGASATLLSCAVSRWGAEHGVNEHGVAVGTAYGAPRGGSHHEAPGRAGAEGTTSSGLADADLVRLALERGTGAAAAADVLMGLLDAHGRRGEPSSAADGEPRFLGDGETGLTSGAPGEVAFLVADGAQVLVVERTVERTGERWSATPFPLGTVVPAGVRSGELTPAAVAARWRAHEGAGGHGGAMTSASMIAELPPDVGQGSSLRVFVAAGSPSTSIYVPAFPLTAGGPPPWVPLELSGQELWQAADEVRRFVEHEPTAQSQTRTALQAVEDELWAEADDVRDDPARWAGVGGSWGARALAALRGCIPSLH